MSKITPNAVSQITLGPTTNPIMNPPPVETKPTHPLNPMPTPPPTHPLNPILNPPTANETPKKLNLKGMMIDGFKQTRGSMTLTGHLNRSVYATIEWVFPKGFDVSTRMFMNKDGTEPRALTKTELRAVKTLVNKYVKDNAGEIDQAMKDGLKRFTQTIDQALKPSIKHPSQL